MIGRVLGELKLKQGLDACAEYRWIQVRAEGRIWEAVDLAGSRAGEQVMLLPGQEVRRFCMGCPGELAAVAVLQEDGKNG